MDEYQEQDVQEEKRWWWMDMSDKNMDDMIRTRNDLVAICDEDAGGIVAYALGEDHANAIVHHMNKDAEVAWDEHFTIEELCIIRDALGKLPWAMHAEAGKVSAAEKLYSEFGHAWAGRVHAGDDPT